MIINGKVYFIHIPRTGGRYIRNLVMDSGYSGDTDAWRPEKVLCGIHIPHLHYPLYEMIEGVSVLPSFTVIREPFERLQRIISYELKRDDKSKIKIDDIKGESSFYNFIECHRRKNSFVNNWYRPQYEFISRKTKLWKYEWGLGNDFRWWIDKLFNVKLKDMDNVTNYFYECASLIRTKIDPVEKCDISFLKPYVEKYYNKDYELWESIEK